MGKQEEPIEIYSGEFRKGRLGKRYTVRLAVYPTYIEGESFWLSDGELSQNTMPFNVPLAQVRSYMENYVNDEKILQIEYSKDKTYSGNKNYAAITGIEDCEHWITLLDKAKKEAVVREKEAREAEVKRKQQEEEERELRKRREAAAAGYMKECYSFHVKEGRPVYAFTDEQFGKAVLYIDEGKSLHFLNIDAMEEQESHMVIPHEKLHYWEKAAKLSYTVGGDDDTSFYGGSLTGDFLTQTPLVWNEILDRIVGMEEGAAYSDHIANAGAALDEFSTDASKVKAINVILNFHSQNKGDYVNIELPADVYDFLEQNYAEQKYEVVMERERPVPEPEPEPVKEVKPVMEAVPKQAEPEPVKESVGIPEKIKEENIMSDAQNEEKISVDTFKEKLDKLVLLKESGLLTEAEFATEKSKLLSLL